MERTDLANIKTRPAGRPRAARVQRRRRGIASVLALLYLLIFSALALGFFSAVTIAAQIAHNDEKALGAQVAAESGLKFVQYQLSRVRVPGNTPPNRIMEEVHKDLVAQQGNSDNVAGRGIELSGETIRFPAGTDNYVALDAEGAGFRSDISNFGDGWLHVTVDGRYRGTVISRTIELYFESVPLSSNIFDFAIVTRGPIRMTGNASIGGTGMVPADNSVLSLHQGSTPLTMNGNPSIAGDAYMTNPRGNASLTGGASVGGSSIRSVRDEHIHIGKPNPDPELPTVDTSIFLPYVTSTYTPGQTVYRNVRIPRNTNPTFAGNVRIEGVMYVESPNQLTFSGKTTVVGVIVVENGATAGSNTMKFAGQFEATGIPDTADFPDGLKALKGSAILAPGFDLSFAGQAGTVGGTVVANSFSYRGNAGGIINGTLIALGDPPLSMVGNAKISRIKPNGEIPAGLLFSRTYRPMHETYTELRPVLRTPLGLAQAPAHRPELRTAGGVARGSRAAELHHAPPPPGPTGRERSRGGGHAPAPGTPAARPDGASLGRWS